MTLGERIAAEARSWEVAVGNIGERIRDEARSWVGVPTYHTGRDRNGVDCLGLMIAIAQALGGAKGEAIAKADTRNYSRQEATDLLRQTLVHYCDPLIDFDAATGEPEAGDVILFRVKDIPAHVGLATGEGTFVHAQETLSSPRGPGHFGGKVEEHPLDRFWRVRIVTVYRYREVV